MNEKSLALLATIAAAMQTVGYHMATEAQYKELAENGLVEVNPEMTEGNGFGKKFAVRLNDQGIKFMSEQNTQTETVAAETPVYAIEDNIAIPVSVRSRASKYPFEDLQVGQSFHVPVTEAQPDPASNISSSASSITAKYKKLGEVRKFTTKKVGANDPRGEGARCWRTE